MEHDPSYKLLFSHPAMVEDLLRGFVHEEWLNQVDFGTLEIEKGDFVSDTLEKRSDDVVWRVKFRDDWLYVYLAIEFQSSVDRWMALRMMVYVGLLYQHLVRSKKLTKRGQLPPVLPLVLYNGEARWTAPLEISELIEPAPSRDLLRYRPQFPLSGVGRRPHRRERSERDEEPGSGIVPAGNQSHAGRHPPGPGFPDRLAAGTGAAINTPVVCGVDAAGVVTGEDTGR